MLADTVVRLAALDNVVGIKEATGEIDRIHELKRRVSDDFAIYSGEDWLSMETMLAGGRGVISVTANVAPGTMRAMCDRALAGDRAGALELDNRLQALHKGLFVESNPIPAKWALEQMGLIGPGIRLPLTPLSASCHSVVLDAMHVIDTVAA